MVCGGEVSSPRPRGRRDAAIAGRRAIDHSGLDGKPGLGNRVEHRKKTRRRRQISRERRREQQRRFQKQLDRQIGEMVREGFERALQDEVTLLLGRAKGEPRASDATSPTRERSRPPATGVRFVGSVTSMARPR